MIFDADASSPLAVLGTVMTLLGGVFYSLKTVPDACRLPGKSGAFAGVLGEDAGKVANDRSRLSKAVSFVLAVLGLRRYRRISLTHVGLFATCLQTHPSM